MSERPYIAYPGNIRVEISEQESKLLFAQLTHAMQRHNAAAERIIRRAILNGDSEAWHIATPSDYHTTTVYDTSTNGTPDATGHP